VEAISATETAQIEALDEGRAFAELIGWRVIAVSGNDARGWLHDLVTANVEGLAPGQARRSLVLTPTGRIRADVHLAAHEGHVLLFQDPDQPEAIDAILAPYVLSSEVALEDRAPRSAIFAVLGGEVAEDSAALVSAPSVLGPGANLVVERGAAESLRERIASRALVEVSPDAIEAWRVRQGRPRMSADFGADSLPSEAGLEDAIDFGKGCFLGQESVAKVRNLGHPRRVLRHVGSDVAIRPGDPVLAGEGPPVGEVTSAATTDGVTDAIVRVRWEAAAERLRTAAGPLFLR
jgi:folate-binding protein YgfZ